jgi:lysophospholipase L1-like esterase
MGYGVDEAITLGKAGAPAWASAVGAAVNDAGRRIASRDAWNIALASFANINSGPSKGLILGSSTFANTGADATKGMVEILGLALQAAYPLDSGSHPTLWAQTLSQANTTPPTANGIHIVNASTSGANSSDILDTTRKNQIIGYAPHWILHSYWANDASSGGINAAATKTNILANVALIDAGYSAGLKPVHILVHPHARGDSTWISGAAALSSTWNDYRDAAVAAAEQAPNGNVGFVDLSRRFAAVGFVGTLNTNPRSMMDTGSPTYVHLNNKGHRFGADALRLELIGR